jgi:hypothetical protein
LGFAVGGQSAQLRRRNEPVALAPASRVFVAKNPHRYCIPALASGVLYKHVTFQDARDDY